MFGRALKELSNGIQDDVIQVDTLVVRYVPLTRISYRTRN